MDRPNSHRGFAAALVAATLSVFALPAFAAMEILTLSNRADLVSGGDVLVEVLLDGADPNGVSVDVDGVDVTSDFALRANNRFMGLVTGLAIGTNVLTATAGDGSGATLTIDNHPPEGPVFTGPHLQPWDCKTSNNGLGAPDANCNAVNGPLVEWFCSTGGSFSSCDPNNPPGNLETLTVDGVPGVRAIVRRETGTVNRGLYSFAVLHDPAEPQAPWIQQDGWTGKMYYPFQASCNTNQTQGSSKAGAVMVTNRLKQGFAVATTSLNELGHHCNPILSAETAMMTKEIFVEQYGQIRYTMSTGGSGGAIGQLQVGNAYPGISQGLMPGQMFADVWSTAIEVGDCLQMVAYLASTPVPYTQPQIAAIDGHGPPQSSCAAWVGTFVPSGVPANGCFSGSTIPTSSTPEARDYNPVTNPDGCRATVNDIQFNVWGPRLRDGFAKRPLDNEGVQYGLVALNLPITDLGNINFAQFLDLNTNIGGVDIDGIPKVQQVGDVAFPRTRTDPEVPEFVYRTGNIQDGRGLAHAAIINFANNINIEIHTSYHAYALEERLKLINHDDNHAIWHSGPSGTAWDTMDAWLEAVEADNGIDPLTGLMDPAKVKSNRPTSTGAAPLGANDSCWSGSSQTQLSDCEGQVFGDARLQAGAPLTHDNLKCQLKPIDAADYPATTTQAQLDALALIFPDGVCDWSVPSQGKGPSVQWLTYEDGPGGQPLGPWPTSTSF